MNKKTNEAGFNKIAIIIVASVICILSIAIVAISMGLSQKAAFASDSSAMEKINIYLATAERSNGKNKTMYEAILDAEKAGYKVSEINERQKNKLVWDQDIDRFVLIDANGKVVAGETHNANNKVKLWYTYSNMPKQQTYSIYANDNFPLKDNLLLSVGFDAGENVDFRKLTYEVEKSSNNVIIRTNDSSLSTELIINADSAVVSHYGILESLTVKSVGENGYYREYGQVKGIMNVKKGQISIESGANVEQLVVDKDATDELVLTLKGNSNVETLVVDSSIPRVSAKANANVSTIVADLDMANITTDPRILSDEIVKTYVSNESELTSAISSKKKYIVLSNNINVTSEYGVGYNLSIDGNGKTITYNNAHGTFLTVTNNNSKLNIKNMKFLDTNANNSECIDTFVTLGVGEERLDKIKLFLYNVDIQVRSTGILIKNNTSCEVNILAKSIINSAYTIYCMGYNCDINVSSSTLISTATGSSNYGMLTLDGGEAMTTFGVNVCINNSTLKAITTGQRNATTYIINVINEGRLTNIEMNSVSLSYTGEGIENLYSTFDKTYGTKIYRNGNLIYSGE